MKRKKTKESNEQAEQQKDKDSLMNLATSLGLMNITHVARPIDPRMETVFISGEKMQAVYTYNTNALGERKVNDRGETMQFECWDSGATRGVEPD